MRTFPFDSRLIVSVLAALMLTACASGPGVLEYTYEGQAEEHVWPGPPDPPRFQLVGQLTGEQNFPRSGAGFGSRLVGWITGLISGKARPVVLQRPQSGFVDEATGRTYITDVSRAAVYVFDEAAGELLVWEAAGRSTRFETPVGIAPGANGEILVVDSGLGRIIRLNADGEPLGSFGAGEFERPVGIARDSERGRIFVSDAQSHDITILDDDGEVIDRFGQRGEGSGEFNAPTYLTYGRDQLFVTDTLNSRVQVFDADLEFTHEFGRRGLYVGDLPRPKGVSISEQGIVYVVESYYDHLLVFTEQGELLLPIGGTGSGIGEFYLPAGVWTDHRNRVYVADAFNGRIMIFQFLGEA